MIRTGLAARLSGNPVASMAAYSPSLENRLNESITAAKYEIGILKERNGTIMYKKGNRMFSSETPKATNASDSLTNWDTTKTVLRMTSAEKNWGKTSLTI